MWYAVGSSLAGGNGDDFTSTGENGFAGSGGFFRTVSTANKSAYAKAGWFFGWTFAGAGCTIVSGAIAERATFLAYALYSVILTGFVYPPVVHMMWTSGKFSAWRSGPRLFGDCGVIDFAGSGTVRGGPSRDLQPRRRRVACARASPTRCPRASPSTRPWASSSSGWAVRFQLSRRSTSTAAPGRRPCVKSTFRRPAPSTRPCPHNCACSMARSSRIDFHTGRPRTSP